MDYTELLIEADSNNLITKEKPLKANKGRIKGNRIAIKSDLPTQEKKCVLAEELGHHYTSSGNIIDMSITQNRKQEAKARFWAHNKLVGLNGIINSYKAGCKSVYEAAEYLDVTEEFLLECIECYRSKYGICAVCGNYAVYFEPTLGVFELIK